MSFEARYRGRCAGCGEDITPGDIVEYDDDRRVVHADCDPIDDVPLRPEDVCTECFIVKPCACEEF